MGGDHGPHVTVPAALEFQARLPDVDVVLVGLRDALEAELGARRAATGPRLRLHHAGEVVTMDEPPAQALRSKKDSSMRVAVNLVKSGEAHACVSAGNTGALMAISRFVLKTLPGIERPAIASVLPTMRRTNTYVLDLGANVDCAAEHLLQFGIMGAMLVAAVEHKERPSVGLLNIGVEDIKGNEAVKHAAALLRASGLNFVGNVEGDDIYKGTTDVVVCDGFVGNVVLKFYESAARVFVSLIKREAPDVLRRPEMGRVLEVLDYANYGGAPLLAVRGVTIICHGSSPAAAIRSAIRVARQAVANHLSAHIGEELASEGASR